MDMNRPTGNVILFIAVCTVFVCTAHGQTCYYTGTCYQQERYTESCGWWWSAGTCSCYRTVSMTCTRSATCTYSLSSYGACSATCGGGVRSCTYQCRTAYCSLPDRVQIQSCNTQICPTDGGWSVWNGWISNGTCSVTCGGGMQTQTRNRTCTNPIAQNGGRQCNGSSTESRMIQCNTPACPIDGGWSAWNGWISNGTCSVTCGGGMQTQTRNRSCTNPIPQNGGRQCNGSSTESRMIQCNIQACPIDGGWSAWNGWISNGTCNVTCDGGMQTQSRNRSCTNPIPQNGGRQCNGSSTESRMIQCNTQACPKECNNGDKKENPDDCFKYLICASGTWKEMSCNTGTVFNRVNKTCERSQVQYCLH